MKETRAHLAAAALFVALSLLMLWPLPRLLRDAAANRTTVLVNAWAYDWDWYATRHREARLFHADGSWPDGLQYGIALFGFPLRAAGLPPLLVHNVLLLVAFAFTGYGGFVLARSVTDSWWAGVVAGIALAFVPWRLAHVAETPWLWAGWLPLMLAALIAVSRSATWGGAAFVAIAFLFNGLSGLHWLAMGTAALAAALVVLLSRKPRALVMVLAALIVALIALAPFVLPFRGMRAASGAAHWPAVPGIATTVLALIGLIGPLGRDRTPRLLVLITAVAWVLLGCAGCLGAFPFLPLATAPWAMVAYTGVALLAGIGAMKIVRHRAWAGALIAALLVYELRPSPLQWQLIEAEPPVYGWLARSDDRGALVEIPPGDRERDCEALFRSATHHRRVVVDEEIARAFAARPIDLGVIDLLRAKGVTALVVHNDALRDDAAAAVRYFLLRGFDQGRLRLSARFDHGVDGDFVFTLGRGDLKPYLGPQPASRPIGWLDEPQPNAEVRGPVRVMGWALAPDGIKRVRVYVNNRARVHEAQLFPRPDVGALYPWHDASRAGFTLDIHRDREGPTDVEVEITDARGRKTLLPQRWFVWAR